VLYQKLQVLSGYFSFLTGHLAGLEITADHRSMIGKKLLMIGGKAGFPTRKKQGKS
jgi:hypothetical protein